MLFIEGKAAETYNLSGKGIPAGALRREILYDSETGASTIINH